jgi:hypothetical protein
MSKVVLDNHLRAKLNGLNSPVEICDETGQTVGHFLPSALYNKFAYASLATECPYSAQELERMHQETGGRALSDLWKELRAE